MRRVLITGSSGFVGSQTLQAFQREGWDGVGIGRRPMESKFYIRHDLATPWDSAIADRVKDVDAVVHAAARSSPWGSRAQFERDNVIATGRLLDFFAAHGSPPLVFISSSSVFYRAQDQFRMDENTPFADPPVNRYAASKQAAEELVRRYPGRWVILRPRAVYGPGDTVLFPRILAAAQAGRLPLLVRSGEPVVGDLIFIHNLTHCIVRAASDADIHGDFNLTDNHPVTIIEFLMDVFRRLGIPEPTRRLSVRTAHRVAFALELLHSLFAPSREPPITRFGVHVFAYSKTFQVQKMLATFGPPPYSTEAGVEEFVDWWKHTEASFHARESG